MFKPRSLGLARSILGRLFLLCLVPVATVIPALWAQKIATPTGLAWKVDGTWQVEGKGAPLQTGSAVKPGSLLQPDPMATPHSIVVLLPDGQRHLYECFTIEDCARGFRVPALYRDPEPLAVDIVSRIRTVLARGDRGLSAASEIHPPLGSPRDEVVATLGPDHQVHVEGLASKLENGRFICDIQPLDPSSPNQLHLALEKTGPFLALPVPSTGLYVVTVNDDANRPRVHLFVAAVSPAKEASFQTSFHNAKVLMQQWNDDFYGWPVHDFQWAYLESLVMDIPAAANPSGAVATAHGALSRPGVVAEPEFSPQPGLLDGDTGVVMHSNTPGATIHYTVDYSQAVASSPVYKAPIMIKGSGLTIKAFASAPGKKDSAAVTGIFRIRRPPQENNHGP